MEYVLYTLKSIPRKSHTKLLLKIGFKNKNKTNKLKLLCFFFANYLGWTKAHQKL